MNKNLRIITTLVFIVTVASAGWAVEPAGDDAMVLDDGSCPWVVKGISVGRNNLGIIKGWIQITGSFPIQSGVTPRPDWFINGRKVLQVKPFFVGTQIKRIDMQAAYLLKDKEENTIEVQFNYEPYNGASYKRTFSYDSDKIPTGGYITF